ncbi:MAG: type 4a pilus biogenesis protein PilO [Proteobacteria bacterium]|nr:type 4a pilus biogenesis protein PilO [Pseudomonadota bacterium]
MAKTNEKQRQSIPPQAFGIIGVLLVIAAVAIGYLGIYEPAVEEYEKAQNRVIQKQNELEDLQIKEAEYNESRKEKDYLERRLDDLRAKLPSTTEELNHFLASINQRSRSARVTKWILYKQEENVSKGEYEAVPIRMEFLAKYEAAIQFFWELASMGETGKQNNREQLINIREVEIKRESTNKSAVEGVLVNVQCVAETYLYTGSNKANPQGTAAN